MNPLDLNIFEFGGELFASNAFAFADGVADGKTGVGAGTLFAGVPKTNG